MSNNPQTDFDGCRRACRRAGAHTLVYGECEQGPEPEPTVSLPRVYTAADGFLAVGFDTYTVPQLARLIEAEVGDPLRAAAAARAIVHRHDSPGAPPAVPTRVSDMTDRRERYATAIREADGWVLDDGQHMIDAVMAVADTELAARRAADLRDAEEICDEAGASYTAKALNEHADAAYELMARFRRKAEEAEQAAVLPAVPVPPATAATGEETDEQRADREETERDHAAGIHTHCGLTCEAELPTEHLRNFVIAKGYPGTKGALDELLRRARAEAAAVPPPADRAAILTEGADELDAYIARYRSPSIANWTGAVAFLRRMADEARHPSPRCVCGETACESELCDCDSPPCPVDHADEAQQQPGKEAGNPRTVCVCGHTRGEHVTVSGRLLCDECDGLSPETCKEFEAL